MPSCLYKLYLTACCYCLLVLCTTWVSGRRMLMVKGRSLRLVQTLAMPAGLCMP